MKLRLSALAACVLLAASPAHADNYPFKDGRGVLQQFASKLAGTIHHQMIVVEGLFAGAPKPIAVDTGGNVGVNCISGCSGGGSSATKANASDPTLIEGSTTNQVSVDLSGYARSIVKGTVTANIGTVGTLATAAKQPALGTAGTPSADVISVQGVTSGTPLVQNQTQINGVAVLAGNGVTGTGSQRVTIASDNTAFTVNLGTIGGAATATNQTNLTGTKAPGTAAANSELIGGVYTSGGITLTTGQQAALQFDSTGHLQVTGGGGGTQFAEDAAHTTGDLGTVALYVRCDTAASTSGTTGDYTIPCLDSTGRTWAHVQAAASDFADGWDVTQGAKADAAWTTGSGSVVALLKAIAGAAIDTTTESPMKVADGSNVVEGAKADAACGTDNGTCTLGAVAKRIAQNLTTINGEFSSSTLVTNAGSGKGATGSAVPANAHYMGANSSGNLTGIIQADASAKVSISTNTITQIVALSSGKKIYVTNFNLHSAGTTTSKFVYGTGSNCGTGTTDLTDLYDFTASDGIVSGGGLGPVLVVPASNALCVSNSAAVHVGGSLAYTQF